MSSEVISLRPSDAIELLTAVLPTKQPVLMLGPPGVGKSSIGRQVAKSLGDDHQFWDLRTTLLDDVDLRGLPAVKDGKTTWCIPDFLPEKGPGVLALEELPQSKQSVQNALFQLILDRRLGDYVLPDDVYIFATGNRVEDRAGAGRTNTALNNRFLHMDLEVSVEDWQDWAVKNNIAPEIRAFIRYRPAMLFEFDPATNPRAFASPRSWEFVNRIMNVAPPHLLQKAVAGCVSSGPAAEFAAFVALYQQMPDLDQCLKNPTTTPIPKEPAILFSLIGALVEKCKQQRSLTGNFAKLGMRLPDEYGVLALRDALSLDKTLVADKAVDQWVRHARSKGLFGSA